ncbi:hypothetical protein [Brevundimonas vesicularis]|uniref:Uncharacterized protein n=1 Tax=Brevundimonas vesicularis TaxID=41276 RepID=A0A1Z3U514_BREVE|nr:hypothetical protein [Brevundimonas vesicularis]ASE38383.1 hypothetical protein CEP68_02055 [Brevundimonas vesicularis]
MSNWNDVNRIVARDPGPRDTLVVTYADGRRIDVTTTDRYDDVLSRASELARQTKLAVKVLPMTVIEFANFERMNLSTLFETPESEANLRAIVVQTLREALVAASDQSTREMARDTLNGMGEALS